jgi:hypothetical protein
MSAADMPLSSAALEAIARKRRVVVDDNGDTTTYTLVPMTTVEQAEFSRLSWAPGYDHGCDECREQASAFTGWSYKDGRSVQSCASCLQHRSLGLKLVRTYKRNLDFDVISDGIRVVIVDGVIQQIGEVKP